MNRREPTIQTGSIMSNPTQKISRRTLTLFGFVVVLLSSIVYFGPTGWAEKREEQLTAEILSPPTLNDYGPTSFLSTIVFPSWLLTPLSTITVNSTSQSPGVIGDCTLGEAIQAANTDAAVDGCSAGSGTDTIILPAGTYTLTTPDPNLSGTGLPDIKTDVIIQGASAATTIIERDANASALFRLLAVSNQNFGSLVLNDVTLRGGRSADTGGALYLARASTLNNVMLVDNIAPDGGGAIIANIVIVNNCSFLNNKATNFSGGAIYAPNLTISSSVFTGNQALHGGGALYYTQSNGARFDITDSTFLNNSSTNGAGGAIRAQGVTTIRGSLFDGNTSGGESGAMATSFVLDISDSVVSNSHANEICGSSGGRFSGD